jgi:hypothetical protein
LLDRIEAISKAIGVTQDAAKKLLQIVGEDPNVPADKLSEALSKVAADYNIIGLQSPAREVFIPALTAWAASQPRPAPAHASRESNHELTSAQDQSLGADQWRTA